MSTNPAPYVTAPHLSSKTLAALDELLQSVQRDIDGLDAIMGDEDHPFARTIRLELSRAQADAARARDLLSLPMAGMEEAKRLRDRARQHLATADAMLRAVGGEDGD